MRRVLTAAALAAAVFAVSLSPQTLLTASAEPDFANDYVILNWEPQGNCYWNSMDPNLFNKLITDENKPSASNLGMFVSSKRMFTREDIPVGSYIQIDQGYQYRPEQWTEGIGIQSYRPNNVTTAQIYVDEEWWGESTYKAFNISAVNSAQIGDKVEEIMNVFRIYVPKDSEEKPSETENPTETPVPTEAASSEPYEPDDTLKILAVGNSFSEDALTYLYNIAKSGGIEKIVLGNVFIGGGTMRQHWENNENGVKCTYQKRNNKSTIDTYSRTLESCIKDEDWDIITLQQGSGSSGMPDTYEPYLTNLLNLIKGNAKNPNVKIGWHMTWAYQQNTTHNEFVNYNKNQMTMYNAIVSTVQQKVIPTESFDFIIPSGTAIQNMRTSYIGDTLTRDTYHMSYVTGRYITGLMWYRIITGQPVDGITYIPSPNGADKLTAASIRAAKEAVNNAAEAPFAVTQSSYTDEYPYIASEPVINGSSASAVFTKIRDTDGSSNMFVAVYDENGVMQGIKVQEETPETNSDIVITLTGDFSERYTAKAFVFENLKTMKPLCGKNR